MSGSEVSLFNKLANREAPKMTLADAMREVRHEAESYERGAEPSEASYRQSQSELGAPPYMGAIAESPASHAGTALSAPPVGAAAETAAAAPVHNHVSTEAEKHATLLEIERLRQAGAATTRSWSMQDTLEDMQLEERKLSANLDEAQMVNTMRAGLELMFTGIELANDRFGFLELEGWSAQMTADMTRYDAALSKLYRRHWRRSTSSPEMEILLTIATSIVTHHVKTKFTKVTASRATASRATPAAPARAAPSRAPAGSPADDDYYGSAANHFEDVTDELSDVDSSGDEGPPPGAT
jgi:hypothetical protein